MAITEISRAIQKAKDDVMQRLRGLVQSAVLQGTDDTEGFQQVTVKILGDDEREQVEHFQQYGITASVPAGARGVFLSVGGKSDGGAAICFGITVGRPDDLVAGEVSLWSQHGQEIRLKADGSTQALPKEGSTFDIGAAATLAIARATDPLTGSAAAATWALVVETAINALAPGTFTGANSWLATVAPPGGLGTIASGGTKGRAE